MGSKFDLLCAEMRYRKKYIPHHAQLQVINILYTQKHMNGKDKNNVLGIKFKYAEVFESMKVQFQRTEQHREDSKNEKIWYSERHNNIHTYIYIHMHTTGRKINTCKSRQKHEQLNEYM
jgi:hypothetical protein